MKTFTTALALFAIAHGSKLAQKETPSVTVLAQTEVTTEVATQVQTETKTEAKTEAERYSRYGGRGGRRMSPKKLRKLYGNNYDPYSSQMMSGYGPSYGGAQYSPYNDDRRKNSHSSKKRRSPKKRSRKSQEKYMQQQMMMNAGYPSNGPASYMPPPPQYGRQVQKMFGRSKRGYGHGAALRQMYSNGFDWRTQLNNHQPQLNGISTGGRAAGSGAMPRGLQSGRYGFQRSQRGVLDELRQRQIIQAKIAQEQALQAQAVHHPSISQMIPQAPIPSTDLIKVCDEAGYCEFLTAEEIAARDSKALSKSTAEHVETIMVCNEDTGFCEEVPIHLAPVDDQSCSINLIDVTDKNTNALTTEIAVVCDDTPDPPAAPQIIHHQAPPTIIDDTVVVCDETTGACEEVHISQAPQTCETQTIVLTNDNGHQQEATVLVCDDEDKQIHAAGLSGHSHGHGEVCPLCGAAPQYQKLVWSLPQYHNLLEHHASPIPAVHAPMPTIHAPPPLPPMAPMPPMIHNVHEPIMHHESAPATQIVTICDADTQVCEEKEIPVHVNIHETMPEHCDVTVVPMTDANGNTEYKEVVICDNTPEPVPAPYVEPIIHHQQPAPMAPMPPMIHNVHEPMVHHESAPATQIVTICDADTQMCEEKEIPVHVNIHDTMPEHCDLTVVPITDSNGNTIHEDVVICDNTPDSLIPPPIQSQPDMKTITVCSEETGTCEIKEIPSHIDISVDKPEYCELQLVPIADEFGNIVHQEVLVCGPEDAPPVPQTKEVAVCSTLTGTCEMVEVAHDHQVLEGCDLQDVPITTAAGTTVHNAIIVDNAYEADHYGV